MENSKIRVCVRKRPLTRRENKHKEFDVIQCLSPQTLAVKETKLKVDLTKYIETHSFTFDQVYNDDMSNEAIYLDAVQPLVYAAFEKTKVTCFAYGQTGSGKTFTMMGEAETPGLYAHAANEIFSIISRSSTPFSVHVSFYEIYCGKLLDLLNDRAQLSLREDGKNQMNIVGLQEKQVTNSEQLLQIIDFGLSARVSGVTAANEDSSRGHAVMQIVLRQNNKHHGKISFIDLAGSERGADTINTDKQTRIDGAEINKSLLALKECIRAQDQGKRHTPFRGSNLTKVLRDSFMGNAKTLMFANISPSSGNCEHTLNTLRYADRVKEMKKGGSGPKTQQEILMLPRQAANRTKTVSGNSHVSPKVTSPSGIPKLMNSNSSRENLPPSKIGRPMGRAKTEAPKAAAKSTTSIAELTANHDNIINLILTEEESLIASHREHIDTVVEMVKQEMNLLHNIDKPGSDIDLYLDSLEQMLDHKQSLISSLKGKIGSFRGHLREESELSSRINNEMNVFDLHGGDDDLLSDNLI